MRAMGKAKEAKEYHMRALKIDEEYFGLNHPHVAIRAGNLSNACFDLTEFQEAKENALRALLILRAHLPDNHPDVKTATQNLAMVELALKR